MSNASIAPVSFTDAIARIRETAEKNMNAPETDPVRIRVNQRIAELEAEKAAREAVAAADVRRRREKVLDKAGIPRRMWSDLDSLTATDAVKAVWNWRAGEKTFLVLEGGVGVGKTYAAASFAASPGGIFAKASTIARMSAFDADAWAKLYSAPALALDDLGTEALDEKGWAVSAILGLIDRRYDDAARTIITTNLGLEKIRARYGQDGGRLFDRLREAAVWVQLGGDSLRRQS